LLAESYYKFLNDAVDIIAKKPWGKELFRFLFRNKNNYLESQAVSTRFRDPLEYYDILGNILYQIGQFKRAFYYRKKVLDEAEKNNKKEKIGIYYLQASRAAAQVGELSAALDYLKSAESYCRRSHTSLAEKRLFEIYRQRVKLSRDKGDYGQAHTYLELMCGNNGQENISNEKGSELLFILGTISRNVGDFEKAIDHFENSKINNRIRRVNYNPALTINNINRNIGITRWMMGSFEKSKEILEGCIEYDLRKSNEKGLARDLINLGMAFSGLGKYDEAIEAIKGSIMLDSFLDLQVNLARAYLCLGIVLRYAGYLDDALKYLEIGRSLHHAQKNVIGKAFALNYEGIVSRDMGHYKAAIRRFDETRKLLDQSKNDYLLANTYRNISIVYRDIGQLIPICEIIKKCSDFDTLHAVVQQNRTPNEESKKCYDFSKKFIEKALDIDKNKTAFLQLKDKYNLAITTRALGDPSTALVMFEEILNLNKNDQGAEARIHRHIGMTYRQLEQYDSALHHFTSALDAAEHMKNRVYLARIYRHLGYTYTKMRDYSKAIKYLNDALEIDKNLGYKPDLLWDYYYLMLTHVEKSNYCSASDRGTEAEDCLTRAKEVLNEVEVSTECPKYHISD
jgi:tetratricopeptide (TPR) repeat protein